MRAASFIDDLRERGIELWPEGDRIRFRAPSQALSEADRAALTANRAEVVSLLREREASRIDRLPLSSGQQSLWLLDQIARGAPVNNLGTGLRIHAALDQHATTVALQGLFDRHPMTRATFHVEDGKLVQHVAGVVKASVSIVDATGLDDAGLHRAVEAEHGIPFALETGPLLRVTLFDLGTDQHVLLLSVHHVVSDALSVLVLTSELLATWAEARGGPAAKLPALEGRYVDFIDEEAAFLAGPDGERDWHFWRDQLADLPPQIHLPTDCQRSGLPAFRGGTVPFTIPEAAVEPLAALARESNATLFTVLLSTWSMFLARLSGATDMIIGTPVSIRTSEASYRVVGDFVNALPLRFRLHWRDGLRQVVAANRGTVVGALEASVFPIQEIIERLGSDRNGTGAPLFNAFFSFHQLHIHQDVAALARGTGDGIDWAGTRIEPFSVPQQLGQFDLTLKLSWFGGSRMEGSLDYASDLFDPATVEHLAADYVRFVEHLVAEPDAPLMPGDDRAHLLSLNDRHVMALPSAPFPAQFKASAARTPSAVAVRCGEAILDYRALDARSDALAGALRDQGAGRGTVVGVHLDRSTTLLVALLAVQKSGAAFLPLDPAFPPARLAHMVSDSGATLLLSDRGTPPEWLSQPIATLDPDTVSQSTVAPPLDGPTPEDTAYLLYTSGSTGVPNGVRVGHRALSNLLGSLLATPGIVSTDVLAAVTTISFDIALVELFAPLLVGATVELLPRQAARDGLALTRELARTKATVMQATPATWRMLVEADWTPPSGFRAISGGEALTPDLARSLLERSVEVWNCYGPTETTIYSTGGRVLDPSQIDVGPPVANTRVYIVGADDDLVPEGTAGRVLIGGTGVAEGYHGQPERTARRFRPDPFMPGERIYDTGDLGRWSKDGRLVLLGRSDDQVKLRGFRIEPGEVEAALASHPELDRAVVAARPFGEDIRLVAFVVHAPGASPTNGDLRGHVREILPDYMVPAMFVALPEMPLTPNGKIDRNRLPNPFAQAAAHPAGRAPRPGLEQTLASIWQDVLGVGQVSADDKFFEIGGHSLLAIRVASALERQTGRRLPPTVMFFQTLGQIAESLSGEA